MKCVIARHLARFGIASFIVILWSGPHLGSNFEDHTRRYTMWERQDVLWRLGPILFYSGLACIVALLVDWSGKAWARRVLHAMFVLALGGGCLTLIAHYAAKLRPYPIPLLEVAKHLGWLLLAGMAGYALARESSRLVEVGRRFCLICSPSLVVLALQLSSGPTYPGRVDPLPVTQVRQERVAVGGAPAVQPTVQGAPSIYWFIFDEWSYERTYENHKLRPAFANLAALSRQCFVFQNAESPANKTELSMPSMLYRTGAQAIFIDGRLNFRDGERLTPADRSGSILAWAGRLGYFRALIGFAQPFAQMVGDELDLCRVYCFSEPMRGPWESICTHAAQTARYSADPLMRHLYARWSETSAYIPYYQQLHADLRRDVQWVLTQSPERTLAIMHYCLPHKPFLFDENGNELPIRPGMSVDSVEGYERHLSCLDHRIGEFMQQLRDAGRFDDSMIIITSDHSWRADPLRRSGAHPVRHVPLIVKLPRQTKGQEIGAHFETYRIGDLIAETLGQSPSQGYEPVLQPGSRERSSQVAASFNGAVVQ